MNEKMMEGLRKFRESGIEVVRMTPIEKSNANPESKSLAIRAMCWNCVGGEAATNPRDMVRNCEVGNKCPLFKVRPWK